MLVDHDTYLEHYGVKGMKWGVRRTPEQLGRDKSGPSRKEARREAKGKRFDAKSEVLQTKIKDINAKMPDAGRHKRRKLTKEKLELMDKDKRAREDAERVRQGKLSKNKKRLAIGVGVAAGLVISYGVYNAAHTGDLNRWGMMGKAYLKGEKPGWKLDRSLSKKDMSPEELFRKVALPVNFKDYQQGKMGSADNCRRCTFAYELRRRGYDVAATRSSKGAGQTTIGVENALNPGSNLPTGKVKGVVKVVKENIDVSKTPGSATPMMDALGKYVNGGKNAIPQDIPDQATKAGSIFKALGHQPNGARGELSVLWRAGSGHSIAWEIVGGKPVIIDAQIGRMFRTIEEFESTYGALSIKDAAFTRLDNIPLNEDFLRKWAKDAK